jgi:hypothetical protein
MPDQPNPTLKLPYLKRRVIIPTDEALDPRVVFDENDALPNLKELQGDVYPIFPRVSARSIFTVFIASGIVALY